MQIRQVLGVIWRNSIVILVTLVLALVAGGVVTALTAKTYQTHVKVLVKPLNVEAATSTQAATVVSSQVTTYAALAETPSVLDPAIKASGVKVTSTQVIQHVSAAQIPETSLIDVTVTGSTGRNAALLANAVAVSLVEQIQKQSAVAGDATITGQVVQAPAVPTKPTSPNVLFNLAVALAVGLIVALGAVVLRQALSVGDPDV